MIKHFLQYQQDTTPEIKKIIQENIAKKRKYQPFHIDCPATKKKICYCINNPVININIDRKTKETIWKQYEDADNYFMGVDSNQRQQAQMRYDSIKTKIQCLSRKEVVDFVKSIQKEKSLMGQIIQY